VDSRSNRLTADQVRLQLDGLAQGEQYSPEPWRDLLQLLRDTLPDLIEENTRLRRALHLSELSRGVPSMRGRD
jgi:hypothetical protein